MTGNRARVEEILAKHFKGEGNDKIREAASEIAALDEEWEEIEDYKKNFGAEISVQCDDICEIAQLHHAGTPLRIFRKKSAS